MKRVLVALVLLSLGQAAPTHAQDSGQDPEWNCADPQAQQEMNYCSDQEYQKADAELNRVWKKALKSQQEMDKQNAEFSPEYAGAEKALRKAQRAWIDYRDGSCDGFGFQAAGGTMQPLLISGCLTRLTKARTQELKELMEGLGN